MTNKAIFLEILKSIRTVEKLSRKVLKECIDEERILDGLDYVLNHLTDDIKKEFVRRLRSNFVTLDDEELDQDSPLIGTPYIIDFSNPKFKNVQRNFFNDEGDVRFLAISFYQISKQNTNINQEVLDFIILFIKLRLISNQKVNIIFRSLFSQSPTVGLLISYDPSNDVERLYLFSYLEAMNSGKNILLDPTFGYNSSKISHSLQFNPAFEYRQYIEVYDIFNELILAKDILTRFLKVYHILEYLSYRMILKKLVKGSNSRSFHQSMKKITKAVEHEGPFIKGQLEILLATTHNDIETAFNSKWTPDIEKLTKDELEFPLTKNADLKMICKFIYWLRCSIVHNKETEVHLHLAIYRRYSLLTPLLHSLIKALEKRLVVIVSSEDSEIKYSSTNIRMIP